MFFDTNIIDDLFFLENFNNRSDNRLCEIVKKRDKIYIISSSSSIVVRDFLLIIEEFEEFDLEDSIYKFIKNHNSDEFSFLFAKIDKVELKFSYLNINMPPILIKNRKNELISLQNSISRLNSKDELLLFSYPLESISTMILSASKITTIPFEGFYKTVFAKKDILDILNDIGDDILSYSKNISFVFFNAEISSDIEIDRVFKIRAKISNIARLEKDVELLLLDYFDNITQNAKTILILNELLFNAYEHGALRIDAKLKQELMEIGEYDDYLLDLEKKIDREIELRVTFYKSGLLRLSINDFGDGFDIDSIHKAEDKDLRGRGIVMSSKNASTLFYLHNGSEVLVFIKYQKICEVDEYASSINCEEVAKELKVLYVEDEKIIREVFVSLISGKVGEVLVSENGKDALDLFVKSRADIVISDINMPIMNGIELCKAIKKISPKTPIIFTTAYLNEKVIYDALSAGANRFISKPIELKILKESLYDMTKKIVRDELFSKKSEGELEILSSRDMTLNIITQEKIASKKQKLIIRDDSSKIDTLDIGLYYKISDILGGDMYGVCKIDENRTLVYLLDPMGKGIVASSTSVLAVSFINRSIDTSIRRDVFDLERLVCDFMEFIDGYILEDEILSFCFLLVDTNLNKIDYVSYGIRSLLYLKEGMLSKIDTKNPPFMKGARLQNIDNFDIDSKNFRVLGFTNGIFSEELCNLENIKHSFKSSSSLDEFLDSLKLDRDKKYSNDTTIVYIKKE